MAKKRTKAQRSAAAKAAWQLRKLQAANEPTKTTADKLPVVEFAETLPAASFAAGLHATPSTAVATKEGVDFYVTVSAGGSLFRHKLSRETVRSLGLDCIKLAG